MRLPLSVLILVFLTSYSFSQTSEELKDLGYIPCSHDHTDPAESCWIKPAAEGKSIDQIYEEAKIDSNQFTCAPRPFRWLIVYDVALLDKYDTSYIETTIREMGPERLLKGFNNSGLTHAGITTWIKPWVIPPYSTIFDVTNMVADDHDGGKLDSLLHYKNKIIDADHLIVITIESTAGRGYNLQNNSQFMSWQKNHGVVNFKTIKVGGNTLCHECGHGLGGGHEDTYNFVDEDAQPYINMDTQRVHTYMMSGNVIQLEVDAFSGPNSYGVNDRGDTIHLWDGYRNNAKYVQMLLEAFWCDNEVTQVALDSVTCGSGLLRVYTNNADSFRWEVVAGDIEITLNEDSVISYIAHTAGTIRLIGKQKGKGYADTAYVDVPAREVIEIDTTLEAGTILPDGSVVSQSGTYEFLDTDINGCDVLYKYNVQLTTSVSSFHEAGIRLYPNPANNQIFLSVNNLEYEILNVAGKVVQNGKVNDQGIGIQDLSPGIYFLKVLQDQNIYQAKFVKE